LERGEIEMIFLYKLKEGDVLKEFDLKKVMDMIANDEMYTFDCRDPKSFWECEILNFKNNLEGNFIIFNTETGLIRRERLGFTIEIIEEELLYIVKTVEPHGDKE